MLYAASKSSPDSIAEFLPEGVTEQMLVADIRAVVNSLDLAKVVGGDSVHLTQMLIGRLGFENTAKWCLMHLLGGGYFFNVCDVNGLNVGSEASDEVVRFEKLLPTLASDLSAFTASFATLQSHVKAFSARLPKGKGEAMGRRFDAYFFLEHFLFQVVQPGHLNVAEDFVLYPAAAYASRMFRQSPVPLQTFLEFEKQLKRLETEAANGVDGSASLRKISGMGVWVRQWVKDNIPAAAETSA